MDFNVKKLASDAGVFFTRAVQVTWFTGCVRADSASLHQPAGAAGGQAVRDPGDAVVDFIFGTCSFKSIVWPVNTRFIFVLVQIGNHYRSVNSSLHPLLMAAIECWNHHVIPPGGFLPCTLSLAPELVHARALTHNPMET